jgi:hypothetical protein
MGLGLPTRSPVGPGPDPETCNRYMFGQRKVGWHGKRRQEAPEEDRET